ncbi:MAG: hypothetical protein V4481_04215 [Patescibacteria group bacterium]
MKRQLSLLMSVSIIAGSLMNQSARAVPVTPTSPLVSLPGATFGGTGIPNTSVAVATSGNATIGLSASARFEDPAVTDDGMGTFFAAAGNDAAQGQPGYAKFNFNWYASGGPGYYAKLLYDLDPAFNNDISTMKSLGEVALSGSTIQDSWNNGMAFLLTGLPLGGGPFNPNIAGEYSYGMQLLNSDHVVVAATYINVQTGSPRTGTSVPETGASWVYLGLGLIGIVGVSRTLKRKEVVAS